MGDWLHYFDSLHEQQMFQVEAEDFVERLERVVPLTPEMRVLDFGCGFGFCAALMARKAGKVMLWDGSPNMRLRAAATIAGHANARGLSVEPAPSGEHRFDLIVVNSVIQYMTTNQVQRWLITWRALVTPGGRLVLADVVPQDGRSYRDLFDQSMFALRRGFLVTALKEGVSEFRRYCATRSARPLTTFSRQHLEQLAAGADFQVQFLPSNLTCRSARMSLLLRPGAAQAPRNGEGGTGPREIGGGQ